MAPLGSQTQSLRMSFNHSGGWEKDPGKERETGSVEGLLHVPTIVSFPPRDDEANKGHCLHFTDENMEAQRCPR